MPSSLDLKPILDFLENLRRHNNKAWFETNHLAYGTARGIFETFVDGVIDVFRVRDRLGDLTARKCMPRINRDIRFSRDKSPYKTNFGALIAPGGWKTITHGYYVSLQPQGQSIVAGGLYDPSPTQLGRFRDAISANPTAFKKLLKSKAFVDAFGAIEGERLKTAPKGYDREHPEIAFLQLKQVTVVHRFSDNEILSPEFQKRVVGYCRTMRPFLDYLTEIGV